MGNYDGKQFSLEPRSCNREVHEADQILFVWVEFDVAITCCQEQLKLLVKIDLFVTDLQHQSRPKPLEILLEDRNKQRFQAVELLHQQCLTKSNSKFEKVRKFGLLLAENFDRPLTGEAILEPRAGLSIGIHHEHCPAAVKDYLAVLKREQVVRKSKRSLLEQCRLA